MLQGGFNLLVVNVSFDIPPCVVDRIPMWAKQEWNTNQWDSHKEENSEERRDSAMEEDDQWASYGQERGSK